MSGPAALRSGSGASRRPSSLLRRMSSRGRAPGAAGAMLLFAMIPALTVVNAGVGLVVPLLLGPVAFGQYSIAVTLFQYGLIFDFGVSQLIDRRVPVLLASGEEAELARFTNDALWLRLAIAVGVMAAGGAAVLALSAAGSLPFGADAGLLSLAAGLLFMLALGPASIDRASSRRRRFAVANIVFALVLAVARPAGILAGGVVGCFAALALCYGVVALRMQAGMPLRRAGRPGASRAWSLLRQGVPFFITSFAWAFYMTANRWVVSFVAPAVELGQFAFGANIVYLAVGSVAALSQFYYPRVTARVSAEGPFAASRSIARDLGALALAVVVPSAIGIVAGPVLIDMFYPKFAAAEPAVRHLLVAVPSLVVVSWLMPLSLSTGNRPWVEGALVYPLALALLMALTYAGYRSDSIGGASAGLVASALALLGMQLVVAAQGRLLTRRHAAMLLAATLSATALLGALALY